MLRFFFNKTVVIIFLGIIFGIAILSLPLKVAIVFILGSLVSVVILVNTEIGLLLTVMSFPFEIAGNFGLSGAETAFQTISAVKILGALTSVSWLMRFARKKEKIIITPQLMVVAGLILAGILSFYCGTYYDDYFIKKGMKWLSMYVIYFAIFFMMTNIIKSRELVKKLVVVLIIVAVMASFYSFVQRLMPRFQVAITSKEDDYYRSHGAIVDPTELSTLGFMSIRTSSFMVHPDAFALFLTLTIPLTIYCLEFSKVGFPKMGWVVILGLQFSGLILTFCRGGMYTLAIIMMLMVIKRVIKPSWEKILTLVAVVAVVTVLIMTTKTSLNRIFDPRHVAKAYSFHGRIDLMRAGVRMFADNNWFVGIGMGNYEYNLPLYSNIDFTYEPTNEYIRVLSEMGTLGVLLSLALFVLTYRDFKKAENGFKNIGDSSMCDLTNTLKACFLGFLFYGLTQDILTRKEIPIVMALAIVLRQLSNRPMAANTIAAEDLETAIPNGKSQ